MSYVLRVVRPAQIQSWVAANAPGSLRPKGTESWRAYLTANGGTGRTMADREMAFLRTAGVTVGRTLGELWGNYTSVSATMGGKNKEKIRNLFR